MALQHFSGVAFARTSAIVYPLFTTVGVGDGVGVELGVGVGDAARVGVGVGVAVGVGGRAPRVTVPGTSRSPTATVIADFVRDVIRKE